VLGSRFNVKCLHFQEKTARIERPTRPKARFAAGGTNQIRMLPGSCRAASILWSRREAGQAGAGHVHDALDRQASHAYSRLLLGAITGIRESKMRPKVCAAASTAVLLSLIAFDSASAEGGCGPGFHRNAYGRCRPNEGPVVVAPAAPVVVAPAAPAIVAPAAPVVVAPAPVVCRTGLRWHPRLRRCVVL
jgi:hypothetical protein